MTDVEEFYILLFCPLKRLCDNFANKFLVLHYNEIRNTQSVESNTVALLNIYSSRTSKVISFRRENQS